MGTRSQNTKIKATLLKTGLSLTCGSHEGCGCCSGLSERWFPLCCLCWLDPFTQLAASRAAQSLPTPPGPARKAPHPTAGARAHVRSCLRSGHHSLLPGFPSPSPISAHCRALLSPKGPWDMGCSLSLPSPTLAGRHKGTSLLGAGKSSIYICRRSS